jgi:hypothetical protein
MIHTCILLKSAYQTNAHACDIVDAEVRGLLWATEQTLEMNLVAGDIIMS